MDNFINSSNKFTIPKTSVIGSSGFIGSAFLSFYRRIYPDSIGTSRKPSMKDNILFLDLLKPDISHLKLSENNYKEAIILSAMSKISECEANKELSHKVNVDGTLELIRQLISEGIKPIFASSDYVFDGYRGNYLDDSPASPITEYGKQKAEVESGIDEISKGNFLVIRLSKVFSLKKGDGTLLDEIASKLASGETILAAYDQIFCPILISDLVNIVTMLQATGHTGIVNICGQEVWSRYNLALEIAKVMKIAPEKVIKVSLADLNLGIRPENTSMKIETLRSLIDYKFALITDCIETLVSRWKY